MGKLIYGFCCGLLITPFFAFAGGVDWNNNESCKECHPKIFKEWKTTRHSKAWVSKQFTAQSQKRTKQDCLPCHAPKPLFESGIGKDLVLREKDRESGVNCIT
ncbi:multiheme c-type cytochrome [Fibrobacterota bacterium]